MSGQLSDRIQAIARLTTVHESREKSNELPLHAFGGYKELQAAVCFAMDLQ
jgi:hypothetical protein